MNVFGMGPGEMILILVVALIAFGPSKLADIGGALGKGVREFRKATAALSDEFTQSMSDVRQPLAAVSRAPLDQQPPADAGRGYGTNNRVCPSCASPNPIDNQFCGHCGAGLTTGDAQAD